MTIETQATMPAGEQFWRVRVAIGRGRAAEARMFQELEQAITRLEKRISADRHALAASHAY